MNIRVLKNDIQAYDWGSKTAIPELLGLPKPHDVPAAEMWMGIHPKGPSRVSEDGSWVTLHEVIRRNPEGMLGAGISAAFSGQLPFLFKVLAAERPLSIQAHPDAVCAAQGFIRENQQKIPTDDYFRNYRDASHKPELLCALTPFSMLCGFRPVREILNFFQEASGDEIRAEVNAFMDNRNSDGLRRFYHSVMTLAAERRTRLISDVLKHAESSEKKQPVYEWLKILAGQYPDDIGALSPFFMNYLTLAPGQAVFIPSGTLHGYLKGTGIELMANSDNVIRGGLTPKHADVGELMKILSFSDHAVSVIEPVSVSETERIYYADSDVFALSAIDLQKGMRYEKEIRSCEILLCISGSGAIAENDASVGFSKGDSFFIPACTKQYCLEGSGLLYKAFMP